MVLKMWKSVIRVFSCEEKEKVIFTAAYYLDDF